MTQRFLSYYAKLFTSFFCAATILVGIGPVRAQDNDTGFIWFAGITEEDGFRPGDWFTSNFTVKRPSFRTDWRRENIEVNEAGEMVLRLHPTKPGFEKDFAGAELQRKKKTHYGRYEVVMTAARGEGVISAFFTYTGAHFNDPHDEIDFEFLGRDTTKVWVTRFASGKRLPGQWLELGFDAAEAPHLYAFEWLEDEIVWYADGRELLRISAADTALPVTPGRVYISIWGGGEDQKNWSGIAPDDTVAVAKYNCMSYRPVGGSNRQCSDGY
ncbi:family 16 glycosylhydrolase [Actibacterium ureilyticum]|uniref:family 16 glycosylhydrolase n=1 Tax=Actibacterium ureilyticum TaxID=1590614 RepID=UPI001FE2758F|nr:family 16 glycosylhydrolase [Actibacterium ureilyticum]